MYLSFISATIKIYYVTARISAQQMDNKPRPLLVNISRPAQKLLRGDPCINLSLVYSRSRKNKLASDTAAAREVFWIWASELSASPEHTRLVAAQIFNSPVFIVRTMNN
jgi:hypothetical protein